MKSQYPSKKDYAKGRLEAIEKKLSIHNKKILSDFLELCAGSVGDAKLLKIKRVILQLYDVTEKDFDKLDRKDIIAFLAMLNHSDKAGWTRHEIKVYVKKFLKWYYKDLSILEVIKTSAKDKAVSVSENDLITEQEFERILESCETIRKKALFTICWESGARPEEILNLKWRDVVFEDNVALLSFHSNKTNTTRTFPVKKAKEFLWYYKEQYPFPRVKGEDYVFVSPENRSSRITTAAANKLLRKAASKAGIDKNVWLYVFRHSRATKLYEELPQQIVEKLLGHKDMAKVYAHISNKKANEELISKIYHIDKIPENKQHELEHKLEALTKEVAFFREFIEGKEFQKLAADEGVKVPKYSNTKPSPDVK